MTIRNKFIEKVNRIHNGKYDYSKVDYKNNKTKVVIICKIHGQFKQVPTSHYRSGCPKCARINRKSDGRRLTTDIFMQRALAVHNNTYDYSKVDYKNCKTNITFINK